MSWLRSLAFALTIAVCACTPAAYRHHFTVGPAAEGSIDRESPSSFDSREFLCRLTGGPADGRHDGILAGRRYTPTERAVAREAISEALRSFGLEPEEHPYRWNSLIDRRYIPPEYLGSGYGESGVNLTATLYATVRSERLIVVGAHYDTVETSPGADDNASGVTATLLVAERLTRLPERHADVMFVFFDQEEIGLVGSCLFSEGLWNGGFRSVDAHILDMVGWDGDRDRAVELTFCGGQDGDRDRATETYFMGLYARAAVGLTDDPDGPAGELSLRHSCRSDHVPFGWFGYRAVHVAEEFSGQDMSPHYHGPRDTCDTLNYGYLRSVAALVATVVTVQIL